MLRKSFKFKSCLSSILHPKNSACFSDTNKGGQPDILDPTTPKKTIYDINTAHEYVKENIRKFDWATYASSNFIPKNLRADYFSIYWFYYELTRAVENTKETSLGLGKMDFWSDSIDKIYMDQPVKEPISICIHHACKNNPLPKSLFTKLISAKKLEISTPEVSDLAHFETIAEFNRTTLFNIILTLLQQDIQNKAVEHVTLHAGKCIGMIDYLKRVPFTLRRYKLFLPDDLMRKHNVSVRNLWNRIEGKPKEELFDVILEVAAHAKKHLEIAREAQNDLPPNAFRAFLQCVEAEYFLEQLEKVNFDIFSKNLHSPAYTVVPYKIFMAARKNTF